MKKSLITLAVASGLMASGAVYADATVYGHAQVEVASWGGDADGMSVEDNARGRVGVKASEDIGDGMKALANFEWKVDTADGDAGAPKCAVTSAVDPAATCKVTKGEVSLQKRTMMVGLKTGMGTIELGRLKSPYKYFGGVKYDPFVATVLEARGNGGMTGKYGDGSGYGHNGFVSDTIAYDNKMGAIHFRLVYDLDDGGSETQTDAKGANGLILGVKFATKKFEVLFAMADDGVETNAAGTVDAYSTTKFGGMVKLGKAGKISAQLEMGEFDDGTPGGTIDVDTLYLDYQFPLDKNNIIDVAFGNSEFDTTGGDLSQDFLRLAVTHKFSKSTKAWVGYRSTEVKDDFGAAKFAFGADIPAGSPSATAFDVSVIAVGLQKKF